MFLVPCPHHHTFHPILTCLINLTPTPLTAAPHTSCCPSHFLLAPSRFLQLPHTSCCPLTLPAAPSHFLLSSPHYSPRCARVSPPPGHGEGGWEHPAGPCGAQQGSGLLHPQSKHGHVSRGKPLYCQQCWLSLCVSGVPLLEHAARRHVCMC